MIFSLLGIADKRKNLRIGEHSTEDNTQHENRAAGDSNEVRPLAPKCYGVHPGVIDEIEMNRRKPRRRPSGHGDQIFGALRHLSIHSLLGEQPLRPAAIGCRGSVAALNTSVADTVVTFPFSGEIGRFLLRG
jgi:hypothetical protein